MLVDLVLFTTHNLYVIFSLSIHFVWWSSWHASFCFVVRSTIKKTKNSQENICYGVLLRKVVLQGYSFTGKDAMEVLFTSYK